MKRTAYYSPKYDIIILFDYHNHGSSITMPIGWKRVVSLNKLHKFGPETLGFIKLRGKV